MKKLTESRTFWLAVAQAIGAVLVVAFTEMDMLGGVLIVKSVLDVILRIETTESII